MNSLKARSLRQRNRGIIIPLIAVSLVILIALTVYIYINIQQNRNLQIATFEQFITDHTFPLKTGTVSFSNFISLDLNAFEQECVTLSNENNFGVIQQHTHTWLVFPQERFYVIDWQTNTAYEWVV